MANRRGSTDSERSSVRIDPWQQLAILSAMASQTPPNGQYSHHSHPSSGTGYGSENASESGGKSPLAMSLGFLKTLTEKKTTRGT